MSSTLQGLSLPAKISLQSGESQVLKYRLKSESKLYQRGQEAIAQIHYKQDGQTEKFVQSDPEPVAFMIP